MYKIDDLLYTEDDRVEIDQLINDVKQAYPLIKLDVYRNLIANNKKPFSIIDIVTVLKTIYPEKDFSPREKYRFNEYITFWLEGRMDDHEANRV